MKMSKTCYVSESKEYGKNNENNGNRKFDIICYFCQEMEKLKILSFLTIMNTKKLKFKKMDIYSIQFVFQKIKVSVPGCSKWIMFSGPYHVSLFVCIYCVFSLHSHQRLQTPRSGGGKKKTTFHNVLVLRILISRVGKIEILV